MLIQLPLPVPPSGEGDGGGVGLGLFTALGVRALEPFLGGGCFKLGGALPQSPSSHGWYWFQRREDSVLHSEPYRHWRARADPEGLSGPCISLETQIQPSH